VTNPVMVVRGVVEHSTERRLGRACWVWCPGCDAAHMFRIVGEDGSLPDGPCWTWDGNLDAPSFQASMLVYETTVSPRCHSIVTNGQWQFLGDCGHALANQTVPMVPLPDWLVH
jgi:Family of unknown function (DUF6527)